MYASSYITGMETHLMMRLYRHILLDHLSWAVYASPCGMFHGSGDKLKIMKTGSHASVEWPRTRVGYPYKRCGE